MDLNRNLELKRPMIRGEDVEAVQERLRSALEAHNRENMERYLEVLLAELKDVQADLLVVEHELPVALPPQHGAAQQQRQRFSAQ